MIKDLSTDAKTFLKQDNLGKYRVQEEILQDLLKRYPDHQNADAVECKAKLLNLFYSTGIQAINKVVEQINGIRDIDSRLAKGDKTLVAEIAVIQLSKGTRTNYSFATKYCALHQPTLYPIYDSIVGSVFTYLMEHGQLTPYTYGRKKNQLTKAKFREMMFDYTEYCKIYDTFRLLYGLRSISVREVDAYIWGSFKDGKKKTEIERLAPIPESLYTEIK